MNNARAETKILNRKTNVKSSIIKKILIYFYHNYF